MTSQLPSCTAT